jgi:hypothetical protein
MTDTGLHDRLFAVSTAVRYVAIYRQGQLELYQRPGIAHASASDSDRYEELIVNPTLLKLLQQRGDIDCGGLDYVLIRYGNFFAFVNPQPDGHVAISLEGTEDAVRLIPSLREVLSAR